MNKVFEIFNRSTPHDEFAEFLVEVLDENKSWLAGRTSQGKAVFIIEGIVDYGRSLQAGALRIDVGVSLVAELKLGEAKEYQRCLVLTLSKSERELEVYFAEIALTLARQITGLSDYERILEHLRTLTSLFGLVSSDRNAIKGLWGELKFSTLFPDPNFAVAKWHERDDGRLDYQSASKGWEIKTTEGNKRVHNFRLHQLTLDSVYVISIVMEESPTGESIKDLVTNLLRSLSPELQYKLRLRTLKFSNSPMYEGLKFRFMKGSLSPKLYESQNLPIPVIQAEHSELISSVSFSLHIPEGLPGIDLLQGSQEKISLPASKALFS